ncbi:LOW QUALITY PROTEIN: uncharacterized protein QC761_100400 [Podospora bellae-mahoneyi]|uniref:Uncharacterized protein n=1 Tax=Podospora bellae-mahoneyi TaxID=2093777 RepID=A0ABR0FVF1_9PEZI|nr:LOW QUALITY PROTEIN: hypothetical protein QC761_100400 [Podospora bellae-mahoneyi]
MDADHRHVCKFDSHPDPNYKMLRNALLTAVDAIRSSRPETPPPQPSSLSGHILRLSSAPSLSDATAAALLRSFLGTGDSFETDLAALQVLKQPGSCQWFTSFFLWTRLVVQEFEGDEIMEVVLEQVPADLFAFYRRMSESITFKKRKATLAKSILT